MKLLRHRLCKRDGTPLPFVRSPNSRGLLRPEYLVMHYTAGASAESSIQWFLDSAAKASAHLVIARDGTITQTVPFNRVAWHAGPSSWMGRDGLNGYSIGIELDNAGKLVRVGGSWRAWFGRNYPDDEVLVGTHRHQTEPTGWHVFSQAQLEAALDVSLLLIQQYGLKDILGHDDISPGRKEDPGPAFPMANFKARLLGRQEDHSMRMQTTTILNIRSGPGTQHPTIDGGPLPAGTRVTVLRQESEWRFVDVLETVNGVMDLQGWVHHRFLGPA